jgi:hypothetical protein
MKQNNSKEYIQKRVCFLTFLVQSNYIVILVEPCIDL